MKAGAVLALGTCCAALWLAAPALAALDAAHPATRGTADASAKKVARAHRTSPYHSTKLDSKAQNYYVATWGVDDLKASYTSSGNLIRFSYRVVDPLRAKVLADRSATPYLYGQRSRVVLQVPVMEKVGPLRQAEGMEAGRDYWMAFSNKGQPVKRGDRVSVMVGQFHVDGLIVE